MSGATSDEAYFAQLKCENDSLFGSCVRGQLKISNLHDIERIEDEIQRANALLDKKQSEIVSNAEHVLKMQQKKLLAHQYRKPPPSKNIDTKLTSHQTRHRSNPSSRQEQAHPSSEPSEEDLSPDEAAASSLGLEAQLRFFKAKLFATKKQFSDTKALLQQQGKEKNVLEQRIAELLEAQRNTQHASRNLQKNHKKLQRERDEAIVRKEYLEKELTELKKDFDKGLKLHSQSQSTEAKAQRVFTELEKCKQDLNEKTESLRQEKEQSKRMNERYNAEFKQLEKQKADLIIAFKKQMKLVDVLKRQKLHIEAAKLLEFSEEEFLRVLSLGEHM